MSRLSDAYKNLKDKLSPEVTGEVAILLSELGSAIEKTEKNLDEVIKESVNRKETIQAKEEELRKLNETITELTKKLTDYEPIVKEAEQYKAEVEKTRKQKEEEMIAQWNKILPILNANQKSPIFDKVQKIKKYFKLPKDENEKLSLDEIKQNIDIFEHYQAIDYFSDIPSDTVPEYEKSGKTDKKEQKTEEGSNAFEGKFKEFNPNQI
ncbi:MAG: hypothetical protein RBR14_06550 [Candidatus Cloacimonas acidaminovorans]|nr:hypothetical protein [Candidatus Cloacimonas acidaminovorans]